jgi:hypothetical protein
MINRYENRTVFDSLTRQIDDTIDEHRNIQTQMKFPTIPMYDSKHWATRGVDTKGKDIYDAAYGQIVRDTNDYDSAWVYQPDDKWHQIGGVARARLETRYPFEEIPVVGGRDSVIVPFNHVYNPYPSLFDSAADAQGIKLYIQAPGVYAVTYRVEFNHSDTGSIDWDTPMWSQLWEPDWDGFNGYDTLHGSINNDIHTTVVFSVSEDVNELWPAGSGWPSGQPLYVAVGWYDPDTAPTTVTIGHNHYNDIMPGSFDGCCLDLFRLGGANVDDLNIERDGNVWDQPTVGPSLATASMAEMPSRRQRKETPLDRLRREDV